LYGPHTESSQGFTRGSGLFFTSSRFHRSCQSSRDSLAIAARSRFWPVLLVSCSRARLACAQDRLLTGNPHHLMRLSVTRNAKEPIRRAEQSRPRHASRRTHLLYLIRIDSGQVVTASPNARIVAKGRILPRPKPALPVHGKWANRCNGNIPWQKQRHSAPHPYESKPWKRAKCFRLRL